MMNYVLSPSILAADFKVLGQEMKKTEENGAAYIHFDVMDELTADIKREEKIALKEEEDKGFLEANIRYLEDNISKDGLTVENFARHLGMSRTAYYNRMKELTGLSPIEFIRQIRIKKALRLMDDGETSITEVAYKTGFNDPKYFSRCFKAEMGMSPTAYLNEKGKK